MPWSPSGTLLRASPQCFSAAAQPAPGPPPQVGMPGQQALQDRYPRLPISGTPPPSQPPQPPTSGASSPVPPPWPLEIERGEKEKLASIVACAPIQINPRKLLSLLNGIDVRQTEAGESPTELQLLIDGPLLICPREKFQKLLYY